MDRNSDVPTDQTNRSNVMNLREIDAVTSFLENRHREYLILERSDRVRTNKLKWEAVSGAIEGKSAYEQALKELEEELGLGQDDVEYKGRSIPFDPHFEEAGIKVRLIYPFLFFVKNPARVKINWEHSGRMSCIRTPTDLERYDTVSMLKETLEALLYQLIEPLVDQGIADVKKDQIHGANQLARKALETMRLAAKKSESRSKEEFSAYMRFIGRELAESRPSMVIIRNTIGMLLHQIYNHRGSSWKNFGVQKSNEIITGLINAQAKAAENASVLIEDKSSIMTCSYSSTIIKTFRIALNQGKSFEVIAAESRFNNNSYGSKMADSLRQHGASVQVVPDSSINEYTLKANQVFVGADSVLNDGSIINGTPTLAIANTAKTFKPFYAVCETAKFNTLPFERSSLENGLDVVPSDAITAIVTEKGLLKPKEAINHMREMNRYTEALCKE